MKQLLDTRLKPRGEVLCSAESMFSVSLGEYKADPKPSMVVLGEMVQGGNKVFLLNHL